MRLRFSNLIIAVTAVLALFSSSCKKDYSKDEPFPDVFTPTVYIGSQNQFVYAFDPQTGAKKWEYNVGANIQASPLVMGDKLIIAGEDGVITKLDAKRGTLIKKIFVGSQILSTPYGEQKGKDGNDYIYFGSGSNNVYAYDVTADTLEWSFDAGNNVISSPTVFDTLVIFGSYNGKVYAVDKVDGAKVWEYDPGTGVPFYSSPTVAAGFVYIGSTDHNMYSLRVNDGSLRWQYATQGNIQSSPISYGGNVIFGSNDYKVYCIDTATGIERWIIQTENAVVSSPYAYNQVIYVGSYDYNLYAINIIDGTIKWKYKTDAIIKSSPMVYDGKLYFGSHDKYLYTVNPEDGKLIWKQNINGLIECSPAVDNLDGKSINTSSISGNSPN